MIAQAEAGWLTAVVSVTGVGVLGALVWRARGTRPAPATLGPVEPLAFVAVALVALVGLGACQLLIRHAHPAFAGAGLLLAFALAYGVHKMFLARVFRPRGTRASRYTHAVLVTWAAMPVIFGVALLVQAFGGRVPQTSVRLIAQRQEGWVAVAVMAVTVAPVLEEIIFRGLLYAGFRKRWGPRVAMAVTACLFALVHEPAAWGAMAVYGAFLAYLVETTGGYGPAIASHALFNGLTVGQLVAAG